MCIDNRDAALESEKIAFDPKVLNANTLKLLVTPLGISMEIEVLVEIAGIFPISSRSGDIVRTDLAGDEFLAFIPIQEDLREWSMYFNVL